MVILNLLQMNRRVRINNSGNVGIGTVSPTEKLEAYMNTKINNTLVVGDIVQIHLYTGLNNGYGSLDYDSRKSFHTIPGNCRNCSDNLVIVF